MKFTTIYSITFILSTIMGMSTAAAAGKTTDTDVSPIPRRNLGFRGQGGRGPPHGSSGSSGDFGRGRDQEDGERHSLFHPEREEDKEAFCMNFNCTRAEENFPADDGLPNCTKPEGPPEIDLEELKKEDPEKYNNLGCMCCDLEEDNDEGEDDIEDIMMSRGQQGGGGGGSRRPHLGLGPHRGKGGKRICAVANFTCSVFLNESTTNCTKPEGPPEIDLEELKKEDPEKYNHLGCMCCDLEDDSDEGEDDIEDVMMSRGQQGGGGGGSRRPHHGLGPHRGKGGKRICAVANFTCSVFLNESTTNCTRPEFESDEDRFEKYFGCRCCNDDDFSLNHEECSNFDCDEVDDCEKPGDYFIGKGDFDKGHRPFGPTPTRHHHAYCMCCSDDDGTETAGVLDGTINLATSRLNNPESTAGDTSTGWTNRPSNFVTSTGLVGSILVVSSLMM